MTFLLFVIITAGVYFIFPRKVQWCWLLISSTIFYVQSGAELTIWMYGSACTIYIFGLILEGLDNRYQKKLAALTTPDKAQKKALKQRNTRVKRIFVWLAAIINIGIWVGFKFTDLLITSINQAFSTSYGLWNLVLPLGISFYTFQAVSYVIDVSHGKCKAQRNPFKLILWLSYFPQMIQGPICRYNETAEQLFAPHEPEYRRVKFGAQLMLWGYFKKLVIADRVAQIAMTVFNNPTRYSGPELLIGAIAYTIQLYGDFSGGIDVISGVSEILGITLPKNFERPYFSRSIAEYWRRWHISLGGWFRDYIFYPLSISKAAQALGKQTRKWFGAQLGKMIPTYIALLIVWTLNGVWHGAGMQYVAYGFYQGILIILGMQIAQPSAEWMKRWNIKTDCFSWKLWQMLRTSLLMVLGRVLYKAPSLPDAFQIWKSIFTEFNPWVLTDGTLFSLGLSAQEMFVLFMALLVLLLVSILQERGVKLREAIERQNLIFRWLLYFVAIFTIILAGAYGVGYNAADFIYANF